MRRVKAKRKQIINLSFSEHLACTEISVVRGDRGTESTGTSVFPTLKSAP
jgi:hypothetical protein